MKNYWWLKIAFEVKEWVPFLLFKYLFWEYFFSKSQRYTDRYFFGYSTTRAGGFFSLFPLNRFWSGMMRSPTSTSMIIFTARLWTQIKPVYHSNYNSSPIWSQDSQIVFESLHTVHLVSQNILQIIFCWFNKFDHLRSSRSLEFVQVRLKIVAPILFYEVAIHNNFLGCFDFLCG